MATSLPWHPFPCKTLRSLPLSLRSPTRSFTTFHTHARFHRTQAISRSDFEDFGKRVASGEAWGDALKSANEGIEQLLYNARKTAERLDRRYSLSRRFDTVVRSAREQAKRIDQEYSIGQRWRTLSMDFRRNWPGMYSLKDLVSYSFVSLFSHSTGYVLYWRLRQYRKQLNNFLETPLGKSSATIFFIWFALSGWLFRFLFLATWVLPFAAPLLIGTLANYFVIEGACPACKKRFMGYRNQVIRCVSCQSIVWQPRDDFSRGSRTSNPGPEIIDIEIEEK